MEGGIAWIVVLATFVINAIVQGIIASSGILLNVLLDQFKHEGKAKIGWIPSLLGGLLLAVGKSLDITTDVTLNTFEVWYVHDRCDCFCRTVIELPDREIQLPDGDGSRRSDCGELQVVI